MLMGIVDSVKGKGRQSSGFYVAPSARLAAAIAAADKTAALRVQLKNGLEESLVGETKAKEALSTAKAAIIEASNGSTGDAAIGYAEARAFVEAAEIRTESIRQKLTASGAQLSIQVAEVEEARLEWRQLVLNEFKAEFLAAAETMSAALRKLAALAEALGDPSWIIFQSIKASVVRWPGESESVLGTKESEWDETGGAGGAGGWEHRLSWRKDQEAVAAFERHRSPLEFEEALQKELKRLNELPTAVGG